MVRFYFSFFVVLLVDRVYIDGTRASINALSLLLLLLVCVSPYFFLAHKGKRKRGGKHTKGGKRRGQKIFFPSRGDLFILFFCGREEEKESTRERVAPTTTRMTRSLSLSPSLCEKWARKENFPSLRAIDRSIDRSREFARLFDCEGEKFGQKRERNICHFSFAFFRRFS